MKKIVIILISLILLISAVNFGTSKPILNNNSTSEADYSIDSSIIDNAQEQQILQNINRLDGFFTENQGQVGNDSVRFYIQGKGVWFLDDGVVFEINEPIKENEVQRDPFDRFHPEFEPENPAPRKSVVLKLNFEGCKKVTPIGRELLPHRCNFFYGNDSSKWCTGVNNFQEILYGNIYDNIDIRYYFSPRGLKYDIIIHPGGNPNELNFRCEGAEGIYISPNNNLEIQTKIGNIIDSNLFIYQNIRDDQIKIDGKYILTNKTSYRFELLTEYNKDTDLIIDPLIYSTYLGDIGGEVGYAIDVDHDGSVYVTGRTDSSNFPNTTGAYDPTYNSDWDVFTIKLNYNGSVLIYSTFIGGSGIEEGMDIVLDDKNNAYITGYTNSTNFPTTLNAYNNSFNNEADCFFLRLKPTGDGLNDLNYSTYFGGSGTEVAYSIALDSNNNAYITGNTYSFDFPTTVGAFQTFYQGETDSFFIKINPSGNGTNDLVYSTFVGGSTAPVGSQAIDDGQGIAVNSSGIAYITGSTSSTNFPITANAYSTSLVGGINGFITKINPVGGGASDLLYSTYFGGNIFDKPFSIDIDSNNNAIVTGATFSTNFPTTANAFDKTFNSIGPTGVGADIFIFKITPTAGAQPSYSSYIGSLNDDGGLDIKVDDYGFAYVTGWTHSTPENITDFPITNNSFDSTPNGGTEAFIFKMNLTTGNLDYSTFLGGGGDDQGWGITIDTKLDIYVTGHSSSSNFPITKDAYDSTNIGGGVDCYITKIEINYLPYVLDLNLSESMIFRTNKIYLYSNATDVEDSEYNLTPIFEYRNPSEQNWRNDSFDNPIFNNSRWETSFFRPKNATLGVYDFRVRVNDTGLLYSEWVIRYNVLTVKNNLPIIIDLTFSKNKSVHNQNIPIGINGTDIEDEEFNLTVELQYQSPINESWNVTYLGIPRYYDNKWEINFSAPFGSPFGYYNFRCRVIDKDGNQSNWFYLNDSLQLYNTNPNIIDMKLSKNSIYRTDATFLHVNGSDFETPEEMLSFYIQYKPQNDTKWTNLTGNYLNNTWEASLTTNKKSILGYYEFRDKFEDNESASSGWIYLNDSLEVLNNLPLISKDLDDISIGMQPLLVDLTHYEMDIEDSNDDLTWSIKSQTYSFIDSIKIIDTINDTLRIVPFDMVAGSEDIELTLTDKDGGTAIKSDITIIVNSLGPDVIPLYKVNLTSEWSNIFAKKGISVDTNLTVKNVGSRFDKYKIEFNCTELQSYININKTSISLEPNKTSIIKLTISIPNNFSDFGIYLITVTATSIYNESISDNALINIEVVWVDIHYKYEVEINISKESLVLQQGESENITLTITNYGDFEDDFNIRFESTDFTSADIQFSKISLKLSDGDSDTITVTINIPQNMEPGEYTIKFIIKGNGVPKESTLTITVTEKDGEEPKDGGEDNTILYAGIGIIVIIIVVLILLFIFLKKKKAKEEEGPVEEAQPPPPEEPPPEAPPQEQSSTPEVPPEQVPTPEPPPSEQPPPHLEVTPQVPQVEPAPSPQPAPMPQVEEQPVPQVEQPPQPQVEVQEPAVEQPVSPQPLEPPAPKVMPQVPQIEQPLPATPPPQPSGIRLSTTPQVIPIVTQPSVVKKPTIEDELEE